MSLPRPRAPMALIALETGDWSSGSTPMGKPQERLGGNYVAIWVRRADGGWKIKGDLAVPGT